MSDLNETLKEINDSRKFATDYINSIFDNAILLECKIEKLKSENEKMRAALEKYSSHDYTCTTFETEDKLACNCNARHAIAVLFEIKGD